MKTESIIFTGAFLLNIATILYAIYAYRLSALYQLTKGGALSMVAIICSQSIFILGTHHLLEVIMPDNQTALVISEGIEVVAILFLIFVLQKFYRIMQEH